MAAILLPRCGSCLLIASLWLICEKVLETSRAQGDQDSWPQGRAGWNFLLVLLALRGSIQFHSHLPLSSLGMSRVLQDSVSPTQEGQCVPHPRSVLLAGATEAMPAWQSADAPGLCSTPPRVPCYTGSGAARPPLWRVFGSFSLADPEGPPPRLTRAHMFLNSPQSHRNPVAKSGSSPAGLELPGGCLCGGLHAALATQGQSLTSEGESCMLASSQDPRGL